MSFILKCQPCGRPIVVNLPNPTNETQLAKAALDAGWIVQNNNIAIHPGILIFCSLKCRNAALTSKGFFRRDLGRGRVKVDP